MSTTNKRFILYKRLFQASKPYLLTFVLGLIGTLLLSATDAAFTWLVKPVINQGFVEKNNFFIMWLPIFLLSVLIIRGAMGFCSNYFINRVARNIVMLFRQKLFGHFLVLPASFYDQQTSGRLLSTLIYNVEQIAQASSTAFVIVLREGTLLLGLLTVMLVISWQLTLLFLIVAPFLSWIIKVSSRRMRKLGLIVQDAMAGVTHVAEEVIEGYKEVRLYGAEGVETERFHAATRLNRHRNLKVIVTNSINTSLIQILVGLPLALALFLAIHHFLNISAGGFAAIIAAMISILRPVRRLTMVNSKIQQGLAGLESVFAFLDLPPEKNIGTHKTQRVKGELEFCDVSIKYANTKANALDHLSFSVKPNQTIAIVGHSGAGKTTLVNLLPRFYEPNQGKILLDGVDITDYELQNLRQQFAFVSQHTTLFNDSVANNIIYGQKNVTEEAIIKAAHTAHAMEFIEKLPEGLKTSIGDNGELLSGGQRQRIAIARALLRNAPILILDEATSSLDTKSERLIQAALDRLTENRTTFVIAHRLSTIVNADWILVLDQGKLVEQGTHESLLKQNGVYRVLQGQYNH